MTSFLTQFPDQLISPGFDSARNFISTDLYGQNAILDGIALAIQFSVNPHTNNSGFNKLSAILGPYKTEFFSATTGSNGANSHFARTSNSQGRYISKHKTKRNCLPSTTPGQLNGSLSVTQPYYSYEVEEALTCHPVGAPIYSLQFCEFSKTNQLRVRTRYS